MQQTNATSAFTGKMFWLNMCICGRKTKPAQAARCHINVCVYVCASKNMKETTTHWQLMRCCLLLLLLLFFTAFHCSTCYLLQHYLWLFYLSWYVLLSMSLAPRLANKVEMFFSCAPQAKTNDWKMLKMLSP